MLRNITPISPRPFLAAESPIWDDRRHCAFFVDIKGHALLSWSPESGSLHEWPVGQDIGFVALTHGDDLILGLKSGLALFTPETSEMRALSTFRPPPHVRLNDGKVDCDGNLFFGVMGDSAGTGLGQLYRLKPSLVIDLVADDYGVPNGPAFTNDGGFFHCATDERRIDQHVPLPQGGGWTIEPFLNLPSEIGLPDGLALDDAGRLWCGLWGGAGILVADTESGQYEKLPIPASYITSMTPIGLDGRKILITSAALPVLRGEQGGASFEGRVFVAELRENWQATSLRFGIQR